MTPNEVSKAIIDAAFKVHTALGAGLLENAYKVCLKRELLERNLFVLSEVTMPIVYEGDTIDVGYRVDPLVGGYYSLSQCISQTPPTRLMHSSHSCASAAAHRWAISLRTDSQSISLRMINLFEGTCPVYSRNSGVAT